MSIISLGTTWSDGDILTASALNGNFSTIVNDYNGSITNANISSTAAISISKLATINESSVVFSGSGHGHTGGTDGKVITINRAFAFYVSGTLVTGTNFGPRYVVPESLTINKVWLIVRTAPTGSAITIDINKNGTTIWTTQGNRATISAGATTDNTTTFDVTALAPGDYLDLDIDTVGSSTAGIDLTVILETTES